MVPLQLRIWLSPLFSGAHDLAVRDTAPGIAWGSMWVSGCVFNFAVLLTCMSGKGENKVSCRVQKN